MDLRTAIRGSRKTGDVIAELPKARTEHGLSPRYLRDLRVRLARFADVFGEQMIATIAPTESDCWLRSLWGWIGARNTFRRRLAEFGQLAGSFRRPCRKRRSVSPRPNAAYSHHRCQREFEALKKWLQAHGVHAKQPLHVLRKSLVASYAQNMEFTWPPAPSLIPSARLVFPPGNTPRSCIPAALVPQKGVDAP